MAFTYGDGPFSDDRYSLLLEHVKGRMDMNDMEQQIIFVGGKGGVGKSTTAAAISLKAAQTGEKTLLVSTDPAHNLSHIFEKKIGGNITKVGDNLHALEIDTDIETKKYIDTVKDNIKGTVQATMMEEVHRQLDTVRASPGADEAALFDKLITIILDESDHFDKLVFDTAPTGHTIRMLSLPELMGIWIEGMLKKRHKTNENYTNLLNDGKPVDDPIYDVLKERQQRFKKVREIMLDGNVTGFIFVLNPEVLPIKETKNALEMLDQYHLHVKTLVVNRILPVHVEGEFLTERKKLEEKHVQEIEELFHDKQLVYIPYFKHDIINMDKLLEFSSYIEV